MTEAKPIDPTPGLLAKFVSRKLVVSLVGTVAAVLLAWGVPAEIAQVAIPSVAAIVVAYAGSQGWVDKTQLNAAAVWTESRAKVEAEAVKAKAHTVDTSAGD